MSGRTFRAVRVLLALALAAAAPAWAQSKKAPKGSAPSAPAAPPKVQVVVDSVLDRRTTRDFPRSELSITFKLEGEDAGAVQSALARVTRAADDTGRNLIPTKEENQHGEERWLEKSGDAPPSPKVDLMSPSRKAKTLTVVEGVVETYLPSRDPAGSVRIDRVMSKKDKPLTVAALASRGIRVQVITKATVERDKKLAEEKKKKADAARRKGKKGLEAGMEEMAGALGDMLGGMIERMFMSAGENDLILKVSDPGKKIFSFNLVASDGSPIQSYGTMDVEPYRIIRMFEPIPPTAALLVRLKTPKSFGELPFKLTDLKLP